MVVRRKLEVLGVLVLHLHFPDASFEPTHQASKFQDRGQKQLCPSRLRRVEPRKSHRFNKCREQGSDMASERGVPVVVLLVDPSDMSGNVQAVLLMPMVTCSH